MSQFGGGRMGSVALTAGGTVSQNFLNIPKGPIERLYLTISAGLKSSGSAFTAVVSTAGSAVAEGVDDLDLILDGLFSLISIYFDPASHAGAMKPSQWRTILGVLNQRDFAGSLLNGSSIPISSGSATTFKVMIPIPISLQSYFRDGAIFRNGSTRLRQGEIQFTTGSSLTPTITLANGSAVVSGLSVSLTAETGAGTEDDVGMTWSVKRLAGLPTTYNFGEGMRLALLDSSPAGTSSVSAWRVGNTELWAPADFGAKYQSERLAAGGYDITQRATPLLWVEPWRTLLDFLGHLAVATSVDAVSGVSSLTMYDVRAIPVPAAIVANVSQQVGAGGPVSLAYPTPASLPPGSAIPPALQSFLPVRVLAGRVSDGGTGSAQKTSGPIEAANKVVGAQIATAAARQGALGLMFRNRG